MSKTDIYLKYQQYSGKGLDTIKKMKDFDNLLLQVDEDNVAFYWAEDIDKNKNEIFDYIDFLEDEIEKTHTLKDILSHLGSDKINVEQAIKLINKYVNNETITIGNIDSPFDSSNHNSSDSSEML